MDRIEEVSGSAQVVARTDVLVVGGGPAGFAAAIAAKREGCSVTLIERYPYLGGLASGGMVLVLDDMHNGENEITVTGLCMEMIERMAKVGAAVYPPPEDRGQRGERAGADMDRDRVVVPVGHSFSSSLAASIAALGPGGRDPARLPPEYAIQQIVLFAGSHS